MSTVHVHTNAHWNYIIILTSALLRLWASFSPPVMTKCTCCALRVPHPHNSIGDKSPFGADCRSLRRWCWTVMMELFVWLWRYWITSSDGGRSEKKMAAIRSSAWSADRPERHHLAGWKQQRDATLQDKSCTLHMGSARSSQMFCGGSWLCSEDENHREPVCRSMKNSIKDGS